MNIDELKNSWNSMNVPPASQTAEAELIARMRSGRVTTLRDRLSNLSVWLMVICAFGIIFMIPNIAATPTLAILGTCFFFLLGGMHFMAYRKVSRLNFSAMTVREAMRMVCEIESDRIRHRTIGIALGVPMVFYMCVTLPGCLRRLRVLRLHNRSDSGSCHRLFLQHAGR